MNDEYKSFLVCFHDGHTDVYKNGLPVGIIRNGQFFVHKQRMADGSEKEIEIDTDLLQAVYEALEKIG